MNRVHYNISGLQNPEMKTHVQNALEKLEGVQMINVDLHRATIEIGYNEPADEGQIKHCIRHAGFEVQ